MAESKSTTQRKEESEQAKRERQSAERVSERQEASAKAQRDQQDRSAKLGKSIDSGTIVVVLRDESDQAAHDVEQLAVQLGGSIKSSSKGKLTVDLPDESHRDTGSHRQKVVAGLAASPLVEDIE
jgi:hypothetical protein